VLGGCRETGDFGRRDGEGNADEKLGNADLSTRHDPVVARLDEDAATRDGVTVHGRNDGSGELEESEDRAFERIEEGIDRRRAVFEQPEEIDSGAEHRGGAGQYDRSGILGERKLLLDRPEELDVESVGFAVGEAKDRDVALVVSLNHG